MSDLSIYLSIHRSIHPSIPTSFVDVIPKPQKDPRKTLDMAMGGRNGVRLQDIMYPIQDGSWSSWIDGLPAGLGLWN